MRFLPLAAIALLAGCSHSNLCNGVQCGTNLVCDPRDGLCKLPAGGVDGGQTADAGTSGGKDAGGPVTCNPSCSGITPICDTTIGVCKFCTYSNGTSQGCGGTTPVCDPSGNGGIGDCITCTAQVGCTQPTPYCLTTVVGGACVTCRGSKDCPSGPCDPNTHTCGGGSGNDGGAARDGGGFNFDGGGSSVPCLPIDAGMMSCMGIECPRGFNCEAGQCVLNGGNGPVQVTLLWNQPEDLDLHVEEPLPTGGQCEIWYGDPNRDGGGPSSCGAVGSLDLDSNPACFIDNVDTENVIYPPGTAPSGTYTVRVDYYQDCNPGGPPVPYMVKVRVDAGISYYCGVFMRSQADFGGAGSGTTIVNFNVP